MKLKLANNLVAGVARLNPFKKFYQWIIQGKTSDIVQGDDNLWYYDNGGMGGNAARTQIKNTQVGTFTGVETIGFTDLTGITITDQEGVGIASINGNNIEITLGYLVWFEISTGERFYLMCGKGNKVYGTLGTVGTLSTTVGIWDNTRDDIEPYTLTIGGTLFQNDTDSEYLRVVGLDLESEIGYTKIKYHTPYECFWNTGNTLQQPSGDAGLFALSEAYSLGWYGADLNSPLAVDWNTLGAYKCYPQYAFERTDNVISRLKLNNEQDIFSTKPVRIVDDFGFLNDLNLTTPPKDVKLIFCGNSITLATTCSPTIKYPDGLTSLLDNINNIEYTFVNLGVGGRTGAEMVSTFNDEVIPEISPNKRNICIFFEFINDTNLGATAQEANDNIKSFNDLCQAQGIETLVMTAPRSTIAAKDANIIACNNILLANNSWADYFFDVNTISEINNPVLGVTTCDGVHLNTLGNEKLYEGVFAYMSNNVVQDIPNDSVIIKNNICFKTNGIDENAFIADNTDVHLDSDFTMFFRFKIKDITGNPRIFSKRTGINWIEFLIASGTYIRLASSSITNGIPYTVNNDDILDISLRLEQNGRTTIFVNGVNEGSIASPINFQNTANLILSNYTTVYSNIEWYEYKLYNRLITDEEAYLLHRQESISNTNLVVDLDFNFVNGNQLNDKSGNNNDFTITSSNIPETRNIFNNFRPWHLTDGCTVFVNNLDITDFKVATYKTDGTPNISSISGFTKIGDFPANSGIIKGLSNTYLGIKYSDWELNEKTFDEIKTLEGVIPPKEDFNMEVSEDGSCIKNMVSQPYEEYKDVNGENVFVGGEKLMVIKSF